MLNKGIEMKCRIRKDEQQSYNPYLKSAILEVVDNQLNENNPPETKQTLERLLSLGHSETKAKEMIASVVTEELYYVMKEDQPFNNERFVTGLNKLK